jgi:phage gp36-like protein
MSWLTPTIDDLRASLGADEIDILRQKSIADGQDVVSQVLARTVSLARASARASGCIMGPAGTIPEEALQPLCNIAAYDLLVRLNIELKASRRDSRDAASKFLENLAASRIQVLGYGEDESTTTGNTPIVNSITRTFGPTYSNGL